MLVRKNDHCDHCGDENLTTFAYDEMCLACCMNCFICLTRAALPYYEFWENEELVWAKVSTTHSRLIALCIAA